ncbi:MAG: glycosyltransferase family 2 protein [Clostridia bacterium]|nr:glycosyltransferase family 2 protein [Clostridia bacterium]
MNNKQPLISVVIPVYNVESYLCRCVESVANQDYSNLEIILIDDGSKDQSGQICDQLAEKDDRIVVIHKENGGLSSARNAGLDVCKGEYISFIDSDDWIEQGMYSTMLAAINEAPSVLLACCGRNDVTDGVKTVGLCHKKNEVICSREAIRRILLWDNLDSAACDKLFHRTIWDHFRFPLGRISEDVAVMYKIMDFAGEIVLVDKPFYNYFHRQGSITTSTFNAKTLDILKNIDEMELFFSEKYTTLSDAFSYFKYIGCSHILTLLAKSTSKHHKDIEKNLCDRLKTCTRLGDLLCKRERIKLFLKKNYFLYNKVYKPVQHIKEWL